MFLFIVITLLHKCFVHLESVFCLLISLFKQIRKRNEKLVLLNIEGLSVGTGFEILIGMEKVFPLFIRRFEKDLDSGSDLFFDEFHFIEVFLNRQKDTISSKDF